MGMYTEIYVNVDLKEGTPDSVLDILKAICSQGGMKLTDDKPWRWAGLFCDGSYYTPLTSTAKLTYDDIRGAWSLLGKGDIKNYGGEIENFFEFIAPWVDAPTDLDFMGYSRYEEQREPTLFYVRDFLDIK